MLLKHIKTASFFINTTKLCAVKSTASGSVTKSAIIDMPQGVVSKMRILSKDVMADVVKKAKKQMRVANKSKCTLVLSGSEIITRLFKMPEMESSALYKNVCNEISSYLPMDITDYNIDYRIIGYTQNGDARVFDIMIVAVPKDIINAYIDVFNTAKLKLAYIDITENSHEKLVKLYDEPMREKNFSIIKIGHGDIAIDTYLNGAFFVSKIISKGMNELIEQAARKESVDSLTMNTKLLSGDYLDSDIDQIVNNSVDDWNYEINRVFEYFRNRNKQANVEKVYICGMISSYKSIVKKLEALIGFKLYTFDYIINPMLKNGDDNIDLSLLTQPISGTIREIERNEKRLKLTSKK